MFKNTSLLDEWEKFIGTICKVWISR